MQLIDVNGKHLTTKWIFQQKKKVSKNKTTVEQYHWYYYIVTDFRFGCHFDGVKKINTGKKEHLSSCFMLTHRDDFAAGYECWQIKRHTIYIIKLVIRMIMWSTKAKTATT